MWNHYICLNLINVQRHSLGPCLFCFAFWLMWFSNSPGIHVKVICSPSFIACQPYYATSFDNICPLAKPLVQSLFFFPPILSSEIRSTMFGIISFKQWYAGSIGSLLSFPSLQLYTSLFGFYVWIAGLTHYVDGVIDSFNRILAEFMQHADIFFSFPDSKFGGLVPKA